MIVDEEELFCNFFPEFSPRFLRPKKYAFKMLNLEPFMFYTNFLSSLKFYFNDFYLNLYSTKEKKVSTKTAPSIENFTNLFIFQYCKNVCRKLNSQVSFIILLFFQRIENSFLSKQINFICEKYKKINKKYN